MYKYKYKYKYHDFLSHPTPLLQSRGLMQSEQFRLHQVEKPEGAIFLKKIESEKEGKCNIICPNCKRSSGNFSLDISNVPGDIELWFDTPGKSGIRFTICRHITGGPDRQAISNIRQGDSRSTIPSMKDLYISDPKDATSSFYVDIYAVPKQEG
jgi:hypothetical protein